MAAQVSGEICVLEEGLGFEKEAGGPTLGHV